MLYLLLVGLPPNCFKWSLLPPLQKRQAEWMEDVAKGLQELEKADKGFKVENLKDKPQFVSAVLNASQAAIRTHQKEKIEELKNAVLNVAKGSGLTEDQE